MSKGVIIIKRQNDNSLLKDTDLLPDDSEGDNSQQHGGGTSGSVEEQP